MKHCLKPSTAAPESWLQILAPIESEFLRAPHRVEREDCISGRSRTSAWLHWSRAWENFQSLPYSRYCRKRQRDPVSSILKTQGLSTTEYARQESLDFGFPSDADFPNVWPDQADLPGFRQDIEACYVAYQSISLQILQALELGLDLPSGSLTERCIPDGSELRFNHYPEIDMEELNPRHTRRTWPYTDIGILSLLLQDRVGGLELEDRQNPGTFLPVSSDDPTQMVVNVGNTLGRWTNGFLPAGLHHVSTTDNMKGKGPW